MATTYNAGVGNVDENGAVRTSSQAGVPYPLTALGPTAALDTGVLDVSGYRELVFRAVNGNTTQTRTFTFTFYAADGTTVLHTVATGALGAGLTGSWAIGWAAGSAGLTSNFAFSVPPKIKVTCPAPASGTGDGSACIWGR